MLTPTVLTSRLSRAMLSRGLASAAAAAGSLKQAPSAAKVRAPTTRRTRNRAEPHLPPTALNSLFALAPFAARSIIPPGTASASSPLAEGPGYLLQDLPLGSRGCLRTAPPPRPHATPRHAARTRADRASAPGALPANDNAYVGTRADRACTCTRGLYEHTINILRHSGSARARARCVRAPTLGRAGARAAKAGAVKWLCRLRLRR